MWPLLTFGWELFLETCLEVKGADRGKAQLLQISRDRGFNTHILEEKIQDVGLVPALWNWILNHPESILRRARKIGVGRIGADLSREIPLGITLKAVSQKHLQPWT